MCCATCRSARTCWTTRRSGSTSNSGRRRKRASTDERLLGCYIRYSSGMCGTGENDMVIASRNLNGYDELVCRPARCRSSSGRPSHGANCGSPTPTRWRCRTSSRDLLSDERDLIRLRAGANDAVRDRPSSGRTRDQRGGLPSKGVTGALAHRLEDMADPRTLDEWLFGAVRDTWHLVGTCRMGAPDDPRTVVDPDCRVLGVDGLRVIDGSIMPEVPRANTNLTCMTIGEHMAARLRRG